jgi:hypothetical protein
MSTALHPSPEIAPRRYSEKIAVYDRDLSVLGQARGLLNHRIGNCLSIDEWSAAMMTEIIVLFLMGMGGIIWMLIRGIDW